MKCIRWIYNSQRARPRHNMMIKQARVAVDSPCKVRLIQGHTLGPGAWPDMSRGPWDVAGAGACPQKAVLAVVGRTTAAGRNPTINQPPNQQTISSEHLNCRCKRVVVHNPHNSPRIPRICLESLAG